MLGTKLGPGLSAIVVGILVDFETRSREETAKVRLASLVKKIHWIRIVNERKR